MFLSPKLVVATIAAAEGAVEVEANIWQTEMNNSRQKEKQNCLDEPVAALYIVGGAPQLPMLGVHEGSAESWP